jgi:hypothetical protein
MGLPMRPDDVSQWNYRQVALTDEAELQQVGLEGWEAVGATDGRALLRRLSPRSQLRAFRLARVARILEGDVPIRLAAGAKVILHIMCAGAASGWSIDSKNLFPRRHVSSIPWNGPD